MKKILSLLVLLVAFTSCEEDVKFNSPAVQGLKDNELWKATTFSAVRSGNSLTVTATNEFETVILKTESIVVDQEYILGEGVANMASYGLSVDGIDELYQTGTGLGNGLIKIRPETSLEKGYVSGNFYFNAVNDAGDIVNYQQGVFYKVPITIDN